MPRTARPSPAAGSVPLRALWWSVAVVVTCGLLVCLLWLGLATVPMSLLTRLIAPGPAVEQVYGDPREGGATLVGGYRLTWRSAPGLAGGPHLGADLRLSGPDTLLTGVARAEPAGLRITGLSGRAGPGLAALVPGAWDCGMSVTVEDVALFWGWRRTAAAGRAETPAGTCSKGRRSVDVPPLTLTLGSVGTDATATLAARDAPPMARAVLRRDRVLDLTIEPAAADVFPALPRGGPIALTLPF